MIVCLCEGINDKTIRRCVSHGADSVEKVARACGAGTGCGSCHREIDELIAQHRREEERIPLAAK